MPGNPERTLPAGLGRSTSRRPQRRSSGRVRRHYPPTPCTLCGPSRTSSWVPARPFESPGPFALRPSIQYLRSGRLESGEPHADPNAQFQPNWLKQSKVDAAAVAAACLALPGVERVMGIEPIGTSRQISGLHPFGEPSAIGVRNFAARGAIRGNVWQLMDATPKDARHRPWHSLAQAHRTI